MTDIPNELVRPGDLVPLGVVHNDDHCEKLMAIIETLAAKRTLVLWGLPDRYSPDPAPFPENKKMALDWVGGPDREAGHPDFPDLKYYCDVSAFPAPKIDSEAGPLFRKEILQTWWEVHIRQSDLTRVQIACEWMDAEHCSIVEAWERAVPFILAAKPAAVEQTLEAEEKLGFVSEMQSASAATGSADDGEPPLAPAPDSKIHQAIAAVYDEVAAAGGKPPNVREIILPTQEKLRAGGYQVSGNRIRQYAGHDQYKKRRALVGVHWTTKPK